jgi:cellulose synthase operon protein C
MDAKQIEDLALRLLANPHDEGALAFAHRAGESNPKAYAGLLERVGNDSRDPSYAAHWLSEAANVWATTLSDQHRAARLLMTAVERDPTHRVSAERLANLYREKGDARALIALLDRRSKAMLPMAQSDASLQSELAGMYEELGRLWSEPENNQPRKAIEFFKRAAECDPTSAYAIYSARELLKAEGAFAEAIPLFEAELVLEQDDKRRLALLRDEAETRRNFGDLPGASKAFARAIEVASDDPALKQEHASVVLDRAQSGEPVPEAERALAVSHLIELSNAFPGEHGFAYASGALELLPGHDAALDVFLNQAKALGREHEVPAKFTAYLEANPRGAFAARAHAALGTASNQAPAAATPKPAAPQPVAAKPPEKEDPLAMFAHESTTPKKRSILGQDHVQSLLETGQALALKGNKPEAYIRYKELLEAEPSHPEALSWVEDYLRSKRDYVELKDVLMASVRAPGSRESVESRKERLREVAGLCESQLRDIDGAVAAWRQLISLDRSDDSARASLTRILERTQRWDDLANVLEQDAMVEPDLESKISLEKKLARLQEDKRKDLVGAADAWSRIARVTDANEAALATAAKLYERAERLDLAAKLLDESAGDVEEPTAKGALLEKLAGMRERMGELSAAGEAFKNAAEVTNTPRMWEEAERLFVLSEDFPRAAHAAKQRSSLLGDAKQEALALAKAAEHLLRNSDVEGALGHLERATDLDPMNDALAASFDAELTKAGQTERLVISLAKRSDRLQDKTKRVAARRRAAGLATTELGDRELGHDLWLKVLKDGDDREALERLIEDAISRSDDNEATTLLRRLSNMLKDKQDRIQFTLQEAGLLAKGARDLDTAVARYEEVLEELDPKCIPALIALAELEERRGNLKASAAVLDKELALRTEPEERSRIALKMARLYGTLEDNKNAIRVLDIVRDVDKEDFDTLKRLSDLCEKTEQWDRVATLLAERIEIEADDDESAQLTIKRAAVLSDHLKRNDEALETLTLLADQGSSAVRSRYVELGDSLGKKADVAKKLVEWWFDAKHTVPRLEALKSAFSRMSESDEPSDAIRVGIELVRIKGADTAMTKELERLASSAKDLDALTVAHDTLAREVSGAERSALLVKQAGIKASAGLEASEALLYGEEGLAGLSRAEASPLLAELSKLTSKPSEIVDLYERQVGRSKGPSDRAFALADAANIASRHHAGERARSFYELALAGTPTEETLQMLENSALETDKELGNETLRRAFVDALSVGGHGARDGGKTRGYLLRRAAKIAHPALKDPDKAFALLSESLTAFVEDETMNDLEKLAKDVGDPDRAEAALSHALGEVFDGPLVRQLLRRRAHIRRTSLGDLSGASQDLKQLHDLNPHDHPVLEELAGAYLELKDFRGLIQTYEDQFLRSKDVGYRTELARKIAKLWEEQLADGREAADAWRRVLRLKPADEEATAGLDRSKKNALQAAPADTFAYLPPPAPVAADVAKPELRKDVPSKRPSMAPTAPRSPSTPPSAAAATSKSVSVALPPMRPALGTDPDDAALLDNLEAKPEPKQKLSSDADLSARKSAPPPLPGSATEVRKSNPPAAPEMSNVLDQELAMSLEKLGGGPSQAPAKLQEAPKPTAIKSLDSSPEIPLSVESEEMMIEDDLAELVDIEEVDDESIEVPTV